jgi:putative DNA primase/helicase
MSEAMNPKDWNDLKRQHGDDAVREAIDRLHAKAQTEENPRQESDEKPGEQSRANGAGPDAGKKAGKKTGKKARSEKAEKPKQGRSLDLEDAEPWPDPVNGAQLLDAMSTNLRAYVVMTEPQAHASVLWILYSHTFRAFDISPRLAITSPLMMCGKSTLLAWLSSVAPRPLEAANISAAAVFRTVELCRPTLLIDEADSFLPRNEELRGIFNSGHHRNGTVIRTVSVGDDFEPRAFSTWTPCIIAAIGKLPTTIMSRSIEISVKRKLPNEVVQSFRISRIDDVFARQCRRWALDHFAKLSGHDPELPSTLVNRSADNWAPLFSIAQVAGGSWPDHVRKAALALTGTAESEMTLGVELLTDIRTSFATRDVKKLASESLIADLIVDPEKPWLEYGRARKPITQRQLSELLKPFRIIPGNVRFDDGGVRRGYKLKQFSDAFGRYLPTAETDK